MNDFDIPKIKQVWLQIAIKLSCIFITARGEVYYIFVYLFSYVYHEKNTQFPPHFSEILSLQVLIQFIKIGSIGKICMCFIDCLYVWKLIGKCETINHTVNLWKLTSHLAVNMKNRCLYIPTIYEYLGNLL